MYQLNFKQVSLPEEIGQKINKRLFNFKRPFAEWQPLINKQTKVSKLEDDTNITASLSNAIDVSNDHTIVFEAFVTPSINLKNSRLARKSNLNSANKNLYHHSIENPFVSVPVINNVATQAPVSIKKTTNVLIESFNYGVIATASTVVLTKYYSELFDFKYALPVGLFTSTFVIGIANFRNQKKKRKETALVLGNYISLLANHLKCDIVPIELFSEIKASATINEEMKIYLSHLVADLQNGAPLSIALENLEVKYSNNSYMRLMHKHVLSSVEGMYNEQAVYQIALDYNNNYKMSIQNSEKSANLINSTYLHSIVALLTPVAYFYIAKDYLVKFTDNTFGFWFSIVILPLILVILMLVEKEDLDDFSTSNDCDKGV